ncbi:hypothetical protein FE257_008933 [Aspergillus nanangensis]|uniref:Uncharacterized protein n=1 Tax=Aspergillus nanangensis TaxID=2582783 RepID=A0AAD4CWW9_ASPNN|nr:hypothetical protein FE257_008933 [Aspergillus nanangensis]
MAGIWYQYMLLSSEPTVILQLLTDAEEQFGEFATLSINYECQLPSEHSVESAFKKMNTQSDCLAKCIGRTATTLGIAPESRGVLIVIDPDKVTPKNVRTYYKPLIRHSHNYSMRWRFLFQERKFRDQLWNTKFAIQDFKRVMSDYHPDVYAQDYERAFQNSVQEKLGIRGSLSATDG